MCQGRIRCGVGESREGGELRFAFGSESSQRLLIGNRYLIVTKEAVTVPATLLKATVMELAGKALGICRLVVLTSDELVAERRHPDTFLGIVRTQHRRGESVIELSDGFIESYRNAPRDRLLDFTSTHPTRTSFERKDAVNCWHSTASG